MCGGQTVGAVVWRISRAIVEGDVMDVDSRAVANAEAMNRIVLDVKVVHRAVTEDFAELNEVVGSGGSVSAMRLLPHIRQTHFATPPLLPSPSHHA